MSLPRADYRESANRRIRAHHTRRRTRLTILDRAARLAISALTVIAVAGCERRPAAAVDTDIATADSTVVASSPQSPVPSPQNDTALATGVGSLRGSIDSAVASTVRRNRP